MSENRAPSEVFAWRLMAILFVALLGWGVYLAIGAFLFNRSMVKGGIVFACSVAFLVFWAAAVSWGRRPAGRENEVDRGASNGWSLAATVTAGVSLAGMLAASLGWLTPQATAYRPILVISQAGMLLGTVLAMIGLSDPLRTRWRGLGLLALALVLVAFTVGLAVPPIEIR